MQKLHPLILPALQKSGTMNDLEAIVTFTMRRGRLRECSVTACAPGDQVHDTVPCATVLEDRYNVMEVIERLFIESAILWRSPAIPGIDDRYRRFYAIEDLMR